MSSSLVGDNSRPFWLPDEFYEQFCRRCRRVPPSVNSGESQPEARPGYCGERFVQRVPMADHADQTDLGHRLLELEAITRPSRWRARGADQLAL